MPKLETIQKGSALLTTDKWIQVLLIDDDEDEYQLTRAMFSRMSANYDVHWASSYETALEHIEGAHPYDIYLIDYRLGDRTGLELLREPAIQHSDVPAILITNHSDQDIDMIALEAGASDYLNKGQMEIRILERTIRYALERAHSLRRLRESEARYRAVIQDQADMIIRFSTDGALTFVNDAYCRFRQQSAEALLGTSYLAPVVEAHQSKLALERMEKKPAQTEFQHEVNATNDDNKTCWHQWTIRKIRDDNDRVIEYQGVIRDITERKNVEDALNARLEQLRILRRVDAELTEISKIDFVISMALDSAMRLGAADIAIMALYDSEMEELQIVRSYGVADLSPVQEIYNTKAGIIGRVMKLKQAEYIPDMHSDPTCTPTIPTMISQMVIPLVSQERFIGIISLETKKPERFNREKLEFIEIVTARIAVSIDNARLFDLLQKRLAEMEELYEQVTKLTQLKTDMIRIAAHDLNNPLHTISFNLQMMEMDVSANQIDRSKFGQFIQDMDKAVNQMNRITNDILALEQSEAAELAQNLIDLTAIIRDAADEHRHSARAKRITYTVDLPNAQTPIWGDRPQLLEATANLISNAIKYTPEGGSVDIVLENDGDAAIVEVIDTGYGIPYEMQEKLFQPFYRAKTKETSDIEGTGLGLHLVRNIIERHDGRMIWRSRYQEGSTFGFQIPMAQETSIT